MNRIGLIALAAALSASAHAQRQYEPAIPKGLADTTMAPSRELAPPAPPAPAAAPVHTPRTFEPVVPQLIMDTRRGRGDADARQCLELASNAQIHRCAHRYLPAAARARVTRARMSGADTSARVRSPAGNVGRADLSRAADAAPPVGTAAPAATAAAAKPAAAPAAKAAQEAKPAATTKAEERPPKWTDMAKGVMKSQGDRLKEPQ